MQSDFVKLDRI